MRSHIFLNVEGFTIFFDFEKIDRMNGFFDLVISFRLHLGDNNMTVNSVPRYVSIDDLQRLMDYIKGHIDRLKQNPDYDSDIFVPTQLGFQLRAFSGEVRSENDGEFSILFLLDIGRSSDDGYSVYVGGESVVSIESINSFVNAIQDLML